MFRGAESQVAMYLVESTPSADLVDAAAEQLTRVSGNPSPDDALAAVILGNDALTAARPSTPAQLANACSAAGFDLVVPPTWGDELVAMAVLAQLAGRSEYAVIACTCRRVADLVSRIQASAPALEIVAPPVAAARALRAIHGDAILITYVGECPSAADPAIDVRFTPTGLFAQLDRQGVSLTDQPRELGSGESNRWRRHASLPGGLPALRLLARAPVDRVLRTLDEATFERGELTRGRSNVLIDLADAAGCACGAERDRIAECEPPRSSVPVVQCPLGLTMGAEPTPRPARVVSLRGPARQSVGDRVDVGTDAAPGSESGAAGILMPSTPDTAATPVGIEAEALPLAPPAPPAAAVPPSRRDGSRAPDRDGGSSRVGAGPRRRALVALPVIVLALTAALGVAVYAGGASTGGEGDRSQTEGTATMSGPADDAKRSAGAPVAAGTVGAPGAVASPPGVAAQAARDSSRSFAAGTDSATSRLAADSGARADSAARAAVRRRARRAALVVPGWMPQGRPAFVPIDTTRRKPDSSAASPDTARPPA